MHLCVRTIRVASEQRAAFFEELMQVGQVLVRAFQAVKMNFEILGNAVRHLHCHIKPRYYGDPAPGYIINPADRLLLLTDAEYQERVAAIRRELGLA
ncbi:MAG TPA: HIT domain-containing protein [Thermomicrobiaceae bacterium]|nr:HIT domain-containing protein [Thermomicrobiaceae bacterium]